MAGDPTIDVAECVRRLRDAQLIPPIRAVEAGRRQNTDILVIELDVPPTEQVADRIGAALGPVPHLIRNAHPDEDGRLPAAEYR